jgi:predicted DNA-binding transcriptional regulator YafY
VVSNAAREAIDLIELAIEKRTVLALNYHDEAGRGTMRDARPLGLWFWGKVWTLIAWCELRDDFRTFRIDRIASVAPAGRSFKPERGKQLADFYRRAELSESASASGGKSFWTSATS